VAAGLGQIKLAQRENEKARAYFERALASSQNDPYQYLNMGSYWYQLALGAEEKAARQQAIDRAKFNFLKAQELNAGLVEFYAMYGQTLLLDGHENDQAVRMLEEAHRLLPSNRKIMLALADAYRVTGEHDKATNVALRAERSLQAFKAALQSHKFLVDTRVAD